MHKFSNWAIITCVALQLFLLGCRRTKPLVFSHHTTWANVAPTFNNICGQCHHSGGLGPFSLTSYEDVFKRKNTILHVLEMNIMPPWRPDTSYSHFLGEYSLGIADRRRIIDWIKCGAPFSVGDSAFAFKQYKTFSHQSQLGNPDTTLSMPHSYVVPENEDHYQNFVVPIPWSKDRFATAIEVVPGNPKAIHHISIFIIKDKKRVAYLMQNNIWHYSPWEEDKQLPVVSGWVKGSIPRRTKSNIGMLMPAGAVAVVNIHYVDGSKGQSDSTHLNIFFNHEKPEREVKFEYFQNYDLQFPANEVKFEQLIHHVDTSISLIGIWPHTHNIARNVLCFATTPQGDTIPLLKINDWHYQWQTMYYFPKSVLIPAGSDIVMRCLYDNTTNNPRNPFDPPKPVVFGLKSSDEMLVLSCIYMNYKEGDETQNALMPDE
jgi:hypothetical protein